MFPIVTENFQPCSTKNISIFHSLLIGQRSQYTRFHQPLQRWIYLQDINFGAPDPEPPSNAMVECTTDVEKIPWVLRTEKPSRGVNWWKHDCTAESLAFAHPPKEPQYNWGGRCGIGFSKQYSQKSPYLVPRVTHKYNCRTTSTEYRFDYIYQMVTNYTAPAALWRKGLVDAEINDYLTQALEAATKNCQNVTCKQTVTNQTREGVSASSTIGRYIFTELLDKIIKEALVVVTLLFPIFEIIIHVIGTIQMCKRDVRFGVLRDWACVVAIPRVAAGEDNDETGTGLKSILFVVYLLGASLATIIALGIIGTSDPDGHFFGKMTYTHMNGKLSTQNIVNHAEAPDVLE